MYRMNKYLLFFFLALSCCPFINAQSWERINDAPFIDDHTNGFGYEDRAYVFRGIPVDTGNGLSNEVWVYTPENDSWEFLTYFPGEARRISIGDDWNGKYYYGFGIGGPEGTLNDLWVFDPVDTSFTQLPSCPCIGRSHPSLIAHNDKIFMGAGTSANGDLNDWWVYDMITQEWTQKQDIPGPIRHHMFHFSSGKYVYVGGGHVFNWNRWDPETDQWSPIDDLPGGRVAGTQFNYNGKGFLLAGDDFTHTHVPQIETFMLFDPEEGEWEYLPSLPNGSRWAPSSFIIDEVVYFMAGYSDIINGDASMWKFDLRFIDCIPPSGLNATEITENSADLFWAINSSEDSDTLKWRKVGDAVWNDIPNVTAIYQLDGLEACEEYEFRVVKVCGNQVSSSEDYRFKTDGCCENPELTISAVTETTALIEWDEVTAAQEYNLRWKREEDMTWNSAVVDGRSYVLTDLSGCTSYELQIETVCNSDDIDFSESSTFRTINCGACLDIEYCDVRESFSADFIFIERVVINGFENISGNSDGYGNFDGALAQDINIGESFTFTFEPGFAANALAFDVLVWIDLDGNGEFESSEQVALISSVMEEITIEIPVPESAEPGLTRMRVFYSNEVDPCSESDDFVFGEAEDYCLNLVRNTSIAETSRETNTLNVYPNPFQNKLVLESKINSAKPYRLKIMNIAGETVWNMQNYKMGEELDLSNVITSGLYFLVAENEDEIFEHRIVKFE